MTRCCATIPGSDGLIALDTDKSLWNHYEACSTVEQLESVLDARLSNAKPVLFYTQPMNVHQSRTTTSVTPVAALALPAGLNARITYEVHWVDSCLGQFFRLPEAARNV